MSSETSDTLSSQGPGTNQRRMNDGLLMTTESCLPPEPPNRMVDRESAIGPA